jgi:uncharacterized protein YecE (DUF72 family)
MILPKGQFRVGTSGYQYEHWKGIFYPDELPKKEWFAHYAKHFDTVEINNTDNHPRRATGDWIYLRFHGDRYSGSYDRQTLKSQARSIKQQLSDGRDVFAYFNNDAEGYALKNAAELKQYVTG